MRGRRGLEDAQQLRQVLVDHLLALGDHHGFRADGLIQGGDVQGRAGDEGGPCTHRVVAVGLRGFHACGPAVGAARRRYIRTCVCDSPAAVAANGVAAGDSHVVHFELPVPAAGDGDPGVLAHEVCRVDSTQDELASLGVVEVAVEVEGEDWLWDQLLLDQVHERWHRLVDRDFWEAHALYRDARVSNEEGISATCGG